MTQCPICGHFNNEQDTHCRKCREPLPSYTGTLYKPKWFGQEKARVLRDRALSLIVLGLLIKVYWGGYGPWPVIDSPTLAGIRTWAEPLLLYGGGVLYVAGWVLNYV